MLPLELVSTYQQYKKDTDSIAAWLASTAKSCGYPSDLLSYGPTTHVPSTRLKGKARAEAKKKQSTTKSSTPNLRKYVVKIKEFVPLAEFVASKRHVSVSTSFMTTLRRVIAARRGFGEKLAQKGTAPDELSDASHVYFADVLAKVYEVLKPRAKPDSSSLPNDNSDTDEFVNRFSSLQVYEPSDDFLNTPDFERPKPQTDEKITYEAEQATAKEDLFIALTMLINDINKIRARIQWIWSNHKDGFFDLAAAAIATNTAIDLARNLMQEVEPMFKDHGGILKVINEWYLVIMMMKGHNPEDLFKDDEADNFNYDTYDDADGTYLLICRLLSAFVPVIEAQSLPMYKEGMFGYYDPRSDRASKTGYEKFQEDRILLMTVFTDLMAVIRGVKGYPVEDELLRGIRELADTREVTLYAVFAAQIFLDIHYILREDTEKCFEKVLQKNLISFDREVEEHFKFHVNLKIDNWPASNDNFLREYQRKIQWILDDPIYHVKVKGYQQVGMAPPASLGRHSLLKMSPVLSGLMLFHFRWEIWDAGITLANAWGSITYSLHLYNALQSEKLVSRTWHDMDIVRSLLSDSSFFVGDAPRSLSQYIKNFCLQMGTTMAVFTNTRRASVGLKSQAGPRGIKEHAPVSRMFIGRYLHGTGQFDWKPEHVAEIIDLSTWELHGTEEDGTLEMEQLVDPKKRKQKAKENAKNSKGSGNANLSPEQLIRGLMFSLQGESLEMSIPYIAMHRQCWSLLRAVRKHCDPLLRQIYTPAYMERETELCFVVGWIFFEPAKQHTANLLVQAGKAVDKFVQSESATILNSMKDIGVRIEYENVHE